MTVIYIDTLFLLNAVVDYLLLLAAAKIAGEPLSRLRFLLGALLGGFYAAAIFLPGLAFLAHPLCRAAVVALIALIAFGGCRRLLRQIIIFLLLSCAFAGGVLAVSLLGGQGLSIGKGVFYSGMDLKIVLISAAGCYALLTLLFRRWGKHTHAAGELTQLEVELLGRSTTMTALVDTGNTLTDHVTGRPVVVAEFDALRPIFPPPDLPTDAQLRDPAGAVEQLRDGPLAGRLRLLPYHAVGIESGLLLAVRADAVTFGGRRRAGNLVAISPTPLSREGLHHALVGSLD